jgi:DNA-binding XRE family transcriptional regulator
MATKELMKVPQSEDIAHEALTMALAILVERIKRLSDDDRNDLFKLVMELPKADSSDELTSITVAMREILEQAPVRVQAMDQSPGSQPGAGLQKWIDYVSDRIRAARKRIGMTQEELADKSGLPQSHISRLENGQHSPSRVTLEKIAAALGVQLTELDPSA